MRAVVVFRFVYAACQFVARVVSWVVVNGIKIKVSGETKAKLLEIELQQQLSSVPGLGWWWTAVIWTARLFTFGSRVGR